MGLFYSVKAQTNNQFSINFNINNGLPSNLIYEVITDRHGYLWIATFNGVVRYNGYDFKTFTTADGLPTNDVWQLLEDNKGRIWLGNISDEFGYLYDGKYHKTILKGENRTVYPNDIRTNGDGLIFYSYMVHGSVYPSICVEKNDTIHVDTFTTHVFDKFPELNNNSDNNLVTPYINFLGEVYLSHKSALFKVEPSADSNKISKLYEFDRDFFENHICNSAILVLGKFLVSYSYLSHKPELHIFNLATGKTSVLDITKFSDATNIEYMLNSQDNAHLYVITQHKLLLFDYQDSIKYNNYVDFSNLYENYGMDGKTIRAIGYFKNWGNVIGSTNAGFNISYEETNHFKPLNIPRLNNFNLLGSLEDSLSFWWDAANSNMRLIEDNGKFKDYAYNIKLRLKCINYLAEDSFMINGNKNYFYTLHNKKIKDVYSNGISSGIATIRDKDGIYYSINSPGFLRTDIYKTQNSVVIDRDKYSGLAYDSIRNYAIAYNLGKIFIHGKTKDSVLFKKDFSRFGTKKTEQILIDNTYGNYLFKGPDNVTIYDPEKNVYKEIFKNINLEESSILLHKNTVIAYGKFGVAFCKLLGRVKASEATIYYNIKNIKYRKIFCCVASKSHLLLSTDKGAYTVDIPSDSALIHSQDIRYLKPATFLLKYRDSLNELRNNDTLLLTQNDRKLQFDIINPYGNGTIHYMYTLSGDTGWHEMNANELNLPMHLAPDNYYTLLLKVKDDVWRSNPLMLTFYFKPLWYQTNTGSRVAWVLISGFIILILTIAILITRRFVLVASQKRTMRLELELKAIYAQINPHFIFNTLNSAMSLAKKNKMEEVYEHISKFSSLLRGYIKSSRNKLTTIEEETENLRDYIDLQLIRFKNKFEYQIIIQPGINPGSTYIPSLLLQPFVENAINHGILHMEEGGFLKIEFKQGVVADEIICIIEDNGIGRKNSKLLNEQNKKRGESYGDLLIKDLVAIFNKYETMNIEIAYTDKETPETGTIVTIKIKNPKNGQ